MIVIHVYLVPHTHDDVGWLQTIDVSSAPLILYDPSPSQRLTDAQGYYQNTVKSILDTVVSSLMANPARRFIYVEQYDISLLSVSFSSSPASVTNSLSSTDSLYRAYFWRWWTDTNTTNAQRDNFRTIYKNGQLEFVIGKLLILKLLFVYSSFQPSEGDFVDDVCRRMGDAG